MHETKNTLPAPTRVAFVELLQARLADALDLHSQAKQAHWNVKGPTFIALHELFDQVASQSYEWTDLIAERLVQLGGTAQGTVRMAAARTTLAEYPLGITSGADHVDALSTALAAFGTTVREAIGQTSDDDQGTADLFTEVSRAVDKLLWFVESHMG